MDRKLYRDDINKSLGGVCKGLADHFNIDVTIVRLVFVLTAVFAGFGLPLYIVLWIVLPKKTTLFHQPFNQPFVDYTMPPVPGTPGSVPPFYNSPKSTTTASVTAGTILIVLGAFFFFRNFGFIPHIHFMHLWPLILIGVGIVYMFSDHGNKRPWEHTEVKPEDNTTNTNPPTL